MPATRLESGTLIEPGAGVVVIEVTSAAESKKCRWGQSPALDPDVTRYFRRRVMHTRRRHRLRPRAPRTHVTSGTLRSRT
jgi:hypothetical protein